MNPTGFPRRLRGGLKVALCGCNCHAACPLTGREDVSDREWEASCSCPGAQVAQDIRRKRRESDLRLRAAEIAVQARAAGRTRVEIREMIASELAAGSGPPPSDGAVDATVDRIARSAEQESAGRTGAARAFGMLAGDVKNLSRMFRTGLKNDISDPGGRDPYYLPSDSPVRGEEVILDPDAGQTLDALAEGRQFLDDIGGVGPAEQAQHAAQPQLVPVRLESGTEEYEIGGERGGTLLRPEVTVHVGKHRLGKLSAEDGGRLRQDLEAARERDQAVWMSGSYFAAAASPARLLLYPGPLPFR
jgi:hypothetical protein